MISMGVGEKYLEVFFEKLGGKQKSTKKRKRSRDY
jgi:hypothetical protein